MFILVILLVALGVVAAVIGFLTKNHGGDRVVEKATCSTCNGENQKCEQECMMEAATKPVEYFDDEELDTFRGRPSDQYTDTEVEQFADVLYTMRQDEVPAWCRSLNLRGVHLPDQLKDEVVMMMEDRNSI